MKHEPQPLADLAEDVLTDHVLIRMVAHGSVIGPFRPTRPLLRGAINCLRAWLWRLWRTT